MRAVPFAAAIAAMVALAGCQVILGIDDPKPADDDIADDDSPIDADPGAIDAMIDAIPIDGPPAQCTLLDPDSCGAGMACDFNPTTVTIECRTDGGTGPLGACSVETDCGPVTTCYHGACRNYCNQDTDCPAPQDHCHALQHPSGQAMCDSRCDWVSTTDGNCGEGYRCRLGVIGDGSTFEMSSECAVGTGGTTTPGNTCASEADCVPGSVCLGDGTGFKCYQLCDPSAPIAVCGSGTCQVFSTDGTNPYTVHGATVGICIVG